jgi:hypothetical protein
MKITTGKLIRGGGVSESSGKEPELEEKESDEEREEVKEGK